MNTIYKLDALKEDKLSFTVCHDNVYCLKQLILCRQNKAWKKILILCWPLTLFQPFNQKPIPKNIDFGTSKLEVGELSKVMWGPRSVPFQL